MRTSSAGFPPTAAAASTTRPPPLRRREGFALLLAANYFLTHVAYIGALSLLTGVVLAWCAPPTEPSPWSVSLFAGISAATNTGLQLADFSTGWSSTARAAWYAAALLGSSLITSLLTPLIVASRLRFEARYPMSDTARLAAERRFRSCLVVALSTVSYVVAGLSIGWVAFSLSLSPAAAAQMTIAAFTNTGPLSKLPAGFEQNAWCLMLMSALIVLGNTLFPIGYRAWLRVLRGVALRYFAAWQLPALPHADAEALPTDDDGGTAADADARAAADDEDDGFDNRAVTSSPGVPPTRTVSANSFVRSNATMESREDLAGSADGILDGPSDGPQRSSLLVGFDDVINSAHPEEHHPWLFREDESWELVAAWVGLVAMQVVPFIMQQWGPTGALSEEESRPLLKTMVALAQCIANRFAGFALLDLRLLSSGHMCIILVALYVPTATGRVREAGASHQVDLAAARRRYRNVFHRVAQSRHFWLFVATCAVLFLEEKATFDAAGSAAGGTRIETRGRRELFLPVLFEVLSAYFTCGLSLPLPSSPASLSSSFCGLSRAIIALCMLLGRHRHVGWMIGGGRDGSNAMDAALRRLQSTSWSSVWSFVSGGSGAGVSTHDMIPRSRRDALPDEDDPTFGDATELQEPHPPPPTRRQP